MGGRQGTSRPGSCRPWWVPDFAHRLQGLCGMGGLSPPAGEVLSAGKTPGFAQNPYGLLPARSPLLEWDAEQSIAAAYP